MTITVVVTMAIVATMKTFDRITLVASASSIARCTFGFEDTHSTLPANPFAYGLGAFRRFLTTKSVSSLRRAPLYYVATMYAFPLDFPPPHLFFKDDPRFFHNAARALSLLL